MGWVSCMPLTIANQWDCSYLVYLFNCAESAWKWTRPYVHLACSFSKCFLFCIGKIYLTFTFLVYRGFVIKIKNLSSFLRITSFHKKNDGIPYHVVFYDLCIILFFCGKLLVLVVYFRVLVALGRSYFITGLAIGMFTWNKLCLFVFLHPILFVTRLY